MQTILTTKNNTHTIDTTDGDVAAWFANSHLTQTHIILRQLNEERFYQPVLGEAEGYTILDIGANIGLFSLYAKDSAARIVAIEPTPATFKMLQKLTAGESKIETVPVALSGHDGTVDFYVNPNPTVNSLVNRVGEKVTVEARTIATILKEHNLDRVDFVKCDIEGGEMFAITPETISEVADRIGFWAVELHQTNADTGAAWPGNLEDNRQALAKVFADCGYQVAVVEHDQLLAWK
jgi:FkbM family methyltransferase